MSENSGRYTCSVVNEVGAAMAMSNVTIISTDNIGVNMTQVKDKVFKKNLFLCGPG